MKRVPKLLSFMLPIIAVLLPSKGHRMNKLGQMTVINFIMLLITLIVIWQLFPILTQTVAGLLNDLTNDGLPSSTNSILYEIIVFIPVLLIVGYLVTAWLQMSPRYANPPE